MGKNDYTSAVRKRRHRALMLEQCKEYVGKRMEIEFTPRDARGRSKGKVSQSGILLGVGTSLTIYVENAAILLADEPDEAGRRLVMINITHINRINLLGITTLLVEDILAELSSAGADSEAA